MFTSEQARLFPRRRRIDVDEVVHYFRYGVNDHRMNSATSCHVILNMTRDAYVMVDEDATITCLECLSLTHVFCDSKHCYRDVPVIQRLCDLCIKEITEELPQG